MIEEIKRALGDQPFKIADKYEYFEILSSIPPAEWIRNGPLTEQGYPTIIKDGVVFILG